MNLKDTVVINIFDNVNGDEKLKELYAEIIKEESLLNKGINKKKVGKSVLSDYINSHAVKYSVTSSDDLVVEEPKEEPIEKVEEIVSVEIKNSLTHMSLGEEHVLDIEVVPQTKHELSIEADGKVIKVGKDNKTLYTVGTGKGWVIVTATNELGSIVSQKYETAVFYEPILINDIITKVNGVEKDHVKTEDYMSIKYYVPDVDISKENEVEILYNVSAYGEDKITKNVYGITKLRYNEFVQGDLNTKIETKPVESDNLYIGIEKNHDIKFGYIGDPKTSEKVLLSIAPNLLSFTDKEDFTTDNWNKGLSDGVITETENGLLFDSSKQYSETIVQVPLSKKIELDDDYYGGTANFLFTAKGKGTIKPILKENGSSNGMYMSEELTSFNVNSKDFTEYSFEFEVNESGDLYMMSLRYGGFILEGEIEIMAGSMKIESDKFGMNDEYVSPKTDEYKYTGILVGQDPTSKYDYAWYADDNVKRIFEPSTVILLPKQENLKAEFGSYWYSETTFPLDLPVLVALNVLGENKSFHKVLLEELTDLKIDGIKADINLDDSTITAREKGEFTVHGTYVSPYNKDLVLEYSEKFIVEEAPNIPVEYNFHTITDDYIARLSGNYDLSRPVDIEVENEPVDIKFTYSKPVNTVDRIDTVMTEIPSNPNLKVSTTGDKISYKDGILTVSNKGDSEKNSVIVEFENPYKSIKLINFETNKVLDNVTQEIISSEADKEESEFTYIAYSETETNDPSQMYLMRIGTYSINGINPFTNKTEITINIV